MDRLREIAKTMRLLVQGILIVSGNNRENLKMGNF